MNYYEGCYKYTYDGTTKYYAALPITYGTFSDCAGVMGAVVYSTRWVWWTRHPGGLPWNTDPNPCLNPGPNPERIW